MQNPMDDPEVRFKMMLEGDIDYMCNYLSDKHKIDGIQIIVSYQSDDGTTTGVSRGKGNYYARFGLTKQWILSEEEEARSMADSINFLSFEEGDEDGGDFTK